MLLHSRFLSSSQYLCEANKNHSIIFLLGIEVFFMYLCIYLLSFFNLFLFCILCVLCMHLYCIGEVSSDCDNAEINV